MVWPDSDPLFFRYPPRQGIMLALVVSIAISAFVGLGNIIAGINDELPNQKLPLLTSGCQLVNETAEELFTTTPAVLGHDLFASPHLRANTAWKNRDDSFALRVWSISYIWQPGIGGLSTLFFGLIFSALVLLRKKRAPRVNESLLSVPFTNMWKRLFGMEYLEKWVDFDSPPHCGVAQKEKSPDSEFSIKLPRRISNSSKVYAIL